MKKFSKIISIMLLIILITSNFAFADIDVSQNTKAVLLGDAETGEILYEYNIDQINELASITKLMTYLVMRDEIESGNISFDDIVTISKHAANTPGSKFGLGQAEQFKLSDLLEPLLVVSGNDVAVAIAEHVGGTEENFVQMMHDKAEEIGITSAKFINSNGMPIDDEETDQNYMSTRDIFTLAKHILNKYPEITLITSKEELVLPERNYKKDSTNPLLGLLNGVDGLKTGYTDKAGLCLVSTKPIIDKADENKNFRIIAIVMGTQSHQDRIDKSIELLQYGEKNYFIKKIVDKTILTDTIIIKNAKIVDANIYPSENFYKLIKNGTEIRTEIIYDTTIEAPLAKGDIVGKINMYIENEKIGEVNLVTDRIIEKANIFVRFARFIKGLLGI